MTRIMTARTRMLSLLALATLAVVGLTGCDPAPPGSGSPTVAPPIVETPTPAAPHAPSAAFIVINAHSVSVGAADSSQLVDIPFSTDIATAAAELSAAIGVEPTVTPVPATSCVAATATYDWDGVRFVTDHPYSDSLGAFIAYGDARQTAGGLDVLSASSQPVGTSLADILANVPGAVSGDRGEGHIEALIDPQGDDEWGVILNVTDGVVTGFYAPGTFLFGHGSCEAGT